MGDTTYGWRVRANLEKQKEQGKMSEIHVKYLKKIKEDYNFYPEVIYDIGANLTHWTIEAEKIWPQSKKILFDAFERAEFLYRDYDYHIGVLSDQDDKCVDFYTNDFFPAGNSYYREIGCGEISKILFGDYSKVPRWTKTMDTVVANKQFPLPDLVKIDVQGSEIDILRGMKNTLHKCQHLIVELQHTDYNEGAPKAEESIPIIESMGFRLVSRMYTKNVADDDYHFMR